MRDNRLGFVLGVLAACVVTLTFLSGEVRAVDLPGDANRDSVVDGVDLQKVLDDYNHVFSGDTWSYGDFDGNSTVNGADLNTVLAHYGTHTSSAAAVPEPATLALLVAGLLGLLTYGWRKRR